MNNLEIATFDELQDFLASLPEGTESTVLSQDIDTGNFETGTFWLPDGEVVNVTYIGL